jgi:hypothetical protein
VVSRRELTREGGVQASVVSLPACHLFASQCVRDERSFAKFIVAAGFAPMRIVDVCPFTPRPAEAFDLHRSETEAAARLLGHD